MGDHSNWRSFAVVLFIIVHKMVLTFQTVDEISNCGNSSES